MNFEHIPHILYVFVAFLVTIISYAFTRDSNLLPIIIGLAGGLGALAQRGDKGNIKNEVENAEVTINNEK